MHHQLVTYALALTIHAIYLSPLSAYPGPPICSITRLPWLTAPFRGRQSRFERQLHATYGPFTHFLIANREDHARFRRTLSHAFSETSMREQEEILQMYVGKLIEGSEKKLTPLNIVAWYNYTTFDQIGHLASGEPFNCLTLIQAKKQHYALTIAKVIKRLEITEERNDFLGCMLRKQGTEKGMSTQELIANSAVLILAGSETTATVLSRVTYFLLRNKRVMEKVVKEVRGAFEREEDITLSGVRRLRVMPGEGAWVDGGWVPGGTIVSVPQLAANLSPLNFHLPKSFIPERFLGDERSVDDNRHALNPFSLGPRNCIGKNLAYAEMHLILAHVFWNFDIQFADGE
ncbi:cytochrome P450 [Cadophora sp. DSE1049]|nr:cytochrome P450 [Cadophora sp. DSE1049]